MSAKGHKQIYAPQKAMSALPPKADVCGAMSHVGFGPIADIVSSHSISSSSRERSEYGIVRPKALAVVRLTINSNLEGCSTGRSAGFAPLNILSMWWAARAAIAMASGPYEKSPPSFAQAPHPPANGIRFVVAN